VTEQKSNAVEIVKKYSNGSIDDNFDSKKKKGSRKTTKVLDKKNNTTLPSSAVEVEKERMDYRVKRKSIDNDESVEERKRALQFRKLKEILMQNVGKGTNISFYRYTKDLIKKYLANPYNYQNEVREVSRYLYRTNTVYKKIINSYATMPLYRYTLMQKYDLTKEPDYIKLVKEFQRVAQRLHNIDIDKEFQNMMIMLIRDGIFCGYVYDNKNDGAWIMPLDTRYIKIRGKNENGQWVVCWDLSYFSSGTNSIFVEPDPTGKIDGLWATCFVEGWKLYKEDPQANRWMVLPDDKIICAIANTNDEAIFPIPFYSGIFEPLMDLKDYEQLASDRAQLENYALLIGKIPLIDDSDRVDDFAVSLELVQEMQSLIDAALPELVGSGYSPLQYDVITFDHSNTTENVDMVSQSISNVFTQAGAEELIVAGSKSSTNTVALRYKILNDTSTCFMWLGRLESSFNYYIKRNMSEHISFEFHQETWFNESDYIQKFKDAGTLGATTGLDYMTALGYTPYSALCKLQMEGVMGVRKLMQPFQNSYSTSYKPNGDIDDNGTSKAGGVYTPEDVGGRPLEDEVDISEKGEEARAEGRVEGMT